MDETTLSPSKAEQNSLSVKELFFKYVRFLPLYIICVALALTGAYVYLRYATESYRSAGQLLIKDEKSANPGSDRLDQMMQADGRKNILTEIEVLQSRQVMNRVVEARNLNFNYFAKGKIKVLNIYKISPFKVEAQKIADSTRSFTLNFEFTPDEKFKVNGGQKLYGYNEPFSTADGSFAVVKGVSGQPAKECFVTWNPTQNQAIGLLGGLVVAPKQNTGILNITMEASSPLLAADIINELMDQYKLVTIDEKNAATRQALVFIDSNLRARGKDLDSITRRLATYQELNQIVDPQLQGSNFLNQIEQANTLAQEQRIQLQKALQLQDYLRSNGEAAVPSSLGLADPTLNVLIENYNRAKLERRQLLANAPAGNPVVQQNAADLANIRGKIVENVRNIEKSYNKAIGTITGSTGSAIAEIKTLPNKKRELLDIQNQYQSKAQLYNTLLQKREESAISLASTISNTRVNQVALPNATPVKPDRKATKILAVVIGLLIPTIIIIIIELLNDKIRSRSDVERLTDATILGEVGHNSGAETLIVTKGNRKVIAEQFRILRSNLQYIITQTPKPVVMVTSSFSGEGKSFISTNMGGVMALANKKTIILEFDIRKPKIMSQLHLPKHKGLTNYILGDATLEELPVPIPGYERLFVLPCGPIPPNPAELLLDPKIAELFVWLRQNFDVVIMDTAPVGIVSDATTLSKYADCTLYIVRQGHTFKKQIGLVDGYHREGKLPKISIVLNDAQTRAGYGGYGYGNSYGYGYGSGYFEEDAPKATGVGKWFGWLGAKNGTETVAKKKKV